MYSTSKTAKGGKGTFAQRVLLQELGLGLEGRALTNPIAIVPPGALGPMHRSQLLLGGLLSSPLKPPPLLRAELGRVRRKSLPGVVPVGGACTAARTHVTGSGWVTGSRV